MLHILKLPPLHFVMCILGMKFLKQSFPSQPLVSMQVSTIIWIALSVFSLFIMLNSAFQFRRHQTNIEAFKEPNNLITIGIYRITRNPIYLGFLIALLGAVFYFNQASCFACVIVFFILANNWYIPHEERDAERIFGSEFQKYKSRVRRWI